MEQRISIVTLGVRDLARARRFYEALGWRGQQVHDTVFFQAGGQAVVLWDLAALAKDAGLAPPAPRSASDEPPPFGGIALAHNVRSAGDVDRTVEAVRAAGGVVTKAPAPTFYGGYAAYVRDPDGHVWEIAHNPGIPLTPDGSFIVPDLGGATG